MPADAINDVIIRIATINDLPAIFRLGERVFTATELSNLYHTWDEYEVTRLFNADGDYMIVAVVEDQVVGFAMGTIIEKARTAWNYGHLLWLAVIPDYGRSGIASRLFDRFRTLMQEAGVRMLLVDTQSDNTAAVRFFRRKGFVNPTDHVYMTLNIENRDD